MSFLYLIHTTTLKSHYAIVTHSFDFLLIVHIQKLLQWMHDTKIQTQKLVYFQELNFTPQCTQMLSTPGNVLLSK